MSNVNNWITKSIKPCEGGSWETHKAKLISEGWVQVEGHEVLVLDKETADRFKPLLDRSLFRVVLSLVWNCIRHPILMSKILKVAYWDSYTQDDSHD